MDLAGPTIADGVAGGGLRRRAASSVPMVSRIFPPRGSWAFEGGKSPVCFGISIALGIPADLYDFFLQPLAMISSKEDERLIIR